MQFLKALVLYLPSTSTDVLNASFDAPGWRVKFLAIQNCKEISSIDFNGEVFDWVIIENATSDNPNIEDYDDVFNKLIHMNVLNMNTGVIQVIAKNDNITHDQHTIFWKNLAQCLYSAYFAPESSTTPVQSIYQNYHLVGHIRLQTPLFARTVSLVLSNISLNPERINLGLWEMLINAVEHGNLGISHEEKRMHVETDNMDDLVQERLQLDINKNKFVTVKFNIDSVKSYFDIQDQGEGFDWKKYWDIDASRLLNKSGRGIALARMAGFDKVDYLGIGNHVQCTIYFVEN